MSAYPIGLRTRPRSTTHMWRHQYAGVKSRLPDYPLHPRTTHSSPHAMPIGLGTECVKIFLPVFGVCLLIVYAAGVALLPGSVCANAIALGCLGMGLAMSYIRLQIASAG